MFNVSSINKLSEGGLAKSIKDFITTAIDNDLFLNNNSKSNVQALTANSLEDNQIEKSTDINFRYAQKEDQIEPEPPRNNPYNGNGYGLRPETK